MTQCTLSTTVVLVWGLTPRLRQHLRISRNFIRQQLHGVPGPNPEALIIVLPSLLKSVAHPPIADVQTDKQLSISGYSCHNLKGIQLQF